MDPDSELDSRIPSLSTSKEFNPSRWSQSSIDQQGGLEITRFRPNIIVNGTKTPFEEDGWKLIKISNEEGAEKEGENGEGEEIEVCFRCARCMVSLSYFSSPPIPLPSSSETNLT